MFSEELEAMNYFILAKNGPQICLEVSLQPKLVRKLVSYNIYCAHIVKNKTFAQKKELS